jgi:MBG domain (YGX type)/Bacterial Ig-like domain (group 3)
MTMLPFLKRSRIGSLSRSRRGMKSRRGCALQGVEARFEELERLVMLTAFVVNSSADPGTNGAHTLRWAITSSNAAPGGTNDITFAIGTGLQTIKLASALPALTVPVDIDGTTQGGSNYVGSPLIVLNGASAGASVAGLVVGTAAAGSSIKGLTVENFSADGIDVQANNVVVAGNFIGTGSSGTKAAGNALNGITVTGSLDTIGAVNSLNANGTIKTLLGNVVSGNKGSGIVVDGSNNLVEGNLVGTDLTGTVAVANGLDGVTLTGGSSNTIGGTTASAANILSGNARNGVTITGNASETNVVEGNKIGTDVTGSVAIGNDFDGVLVASSNNTIGGTVAGAGNVIAGNQGDGVVLNGSSNTVAGNDIGTVAGGNTALGNQSDGVLIQGASYNTIGGGSALAGNVISGNAYQGIELVNVPPPPPPPGTTSAGAGPLTLTPTAVADNFSVEDFANNFPDEPNSQGGEGPFGIAFPSTGGVLVTDQSESGSTVSESTRFFASDVDNQNAPTASVIGQTYGASDAMGLASSGGKIYMAFKGTDPSGAKTGGLDLINNNGTFNKTIASNLGDDCEGTATDPINGHIILSDGDNGNIYDVNPTGSYTSTKLPPKIVSISGDNFDGVSISADGQTLYAADKTHNEIVVFNLASYISTGKTLTKPTSVIPFGTATTSQGQTATVGDVDGTALGQGTLAGELFVNTNTGTYPVVNGSTTTNVSGGMVLEIDLATLSETIISYGSTRGDFVTVDPSNGTLLLDYSTEIIRLFPPAGSSFGGGPSTTANNVIQGNEIGTNAAGTAAVPNGNCGIFLQDGATSNLIGTNGDGVNDAAERNVVSGNAFQGIFMGDPGTSFNVVAGNFVGTDVTGTQPISNGNGGVWIDNGATENRIGVLAGDVDAAHEGNVLSANSYSGVAVGGDGTGTSDNTIMGNAIGTDPSDTLNLGNGNSGISFFAGATLNTVGGPGVLANAIANNAIAGINVVDPTAVQNTLRDNSIYGNAQLGIDLGGDGVTLNDSHAGQAGPNDWQDFPVLTTVYSNGNTAEINGTAYGTTGATVTIDFYGNVAADPSGYGQGQVSLGSTTALAGSSFRTFLTGPLTTVGFITATETSAGGDTSEFSQDVAITPVTTTVSVSGAPSPSTYGQAVTFTASVGGTPSPSGTVQFEVDGTDFGGGVTLVNGVATSPGLSTLSAGVHTITAVYSGDVLHPATIASTTQTVDPAPLTVTANAQTAIYGGPLPNLTDSITGFVNGDTSAVVSGVANLSTSAVTGDPVGAYPIRVAVGTLSAANYDFPNLVSGTLAINKAHLTVTANPSSTTYGTAPTGLSATITGFVNGDNASVVSGSPLLSTTETDTSGVGTYPIDVAAGSLSATNYDFTNLIAGTLTVNQADLAVVPDNITTGIGQAPNLTWHYTGFVGNDTAVSAGITGSPVLSSNAPNNYPLGTYTIGVTSAGSLSAANYDFPAADFGTGTLTVVQQAAPTLNVSLATTNPVYGQSLTFLASAAGASGSPTPTGSFQFLIDGNPSGQLVALTGGSASYTPSTFLTAGAHTVSVLYSGDSIYPTTTSNIDLFNVAKVALTVTVNPATRAYGASNPAFSVGYNGFVPGDSSSDLGGALTYTPTAPPTAPVGLYTVSASGLTAANYNINYVPGAFNVTPATLTVTVNPVSITYGQSIPVLSPSYSGFQFNDNTSVLSGAPTITRPSGTILPVNTYTIGVAVGTLKASNYTIVAAPGVLTVNKAHLTVTATSVSRPSGQQNPTLKYTITGFVNGDTAAVVSGAPVESTTAKTTSPVGAYAITVSAGTLSAANYDFPNLVNGVLTVGIAPINDYTGAGQSDPAVFRRTSATVAQWFAQGSTIINTRSFGAGGLDIPIAADFDGDGKTDLAVYRPSTSQWFVEESSTNYTGQLLATFGGPNDIPVPANYNGTGKAIVAVYRPTTGQWFFAGQSQPLTFTTFKTGDIPVPGNYDNTGKDEPAIYRPSTGQWIIDGPNGVHTISFGGSTDIPVPGAYNVLTAGNAAVEPAVWRPSTGQFFIRTPTGGTTLDQFKVGDIPAPGDYDGIGETEAAVYRPSTSQWLVMGPNDKTPRVVAAYGGPNDTPTAAPYIERALKSGGGLISKFSVETPVAVDLGATARAFAAPPASSSLLLTWTKASAPTSTREIQPAPSVLVASPPPRLTVLQRVTEQIDRLRARDESDGTVL